MSMNIRFEELSAPLKYFMLKVGKAEMALTPLPDKKVLILYNDNVQWCSYDTQTREEIKEQFVEINLAHGRVVTTGLGFGFVQTILAQKEDVREVIVYEKNSDVIEMFKIFAETSNFNTDKIKIINEDANNIRGIECDWLIMDHFEGQHQPHWEILDYVRELSNHNNPQNVWFWPILNLYHVFCMKKQLPICNYSFNYFSRKLRVKNLPESLSDAYFEKIKILLNSRIKKPSFN